MILLDANVLLEIVIAGRSHSEKVLRFLEQNKDPFCISMLTVHLVLHFGIKDGMTLSDIRTFLADYPKSALLAEDYVKALEILRGNDHEDALQLAIAERNRCTKIATLDNKFIENYKHRIDFINPAKI